MTIDNPAIVTVTTAATSLGGGDTDEATVMFYNEGPQTIYLGGSAVTAATGIPIAVGQTVTSDVYGNEQFSAITLSGTSTVRRMRRGI